MRKQWIINKGQRSQDGGPPSPPGGGGREGTTIRIHTRYRIPILGTVSKWLGIVVPSPPGGGPWLFEHIVGTVSLYLGIVVLSPGGGMTIRTYIRYRKPIPWNSSAPPRWGVSPSTSAFPAKIFIMSLSRVGVGLPFGLKDLWSPKLGYAPKIKNKFVLKTEV